MRVPAVSATSLRDLQRNLLEIGRLQERLSSGRRLNRPSDAPADAVISDRLRAEMSAFSQAAENLSRTQGVLDTADGALAQASELLSRGQALTLEAQGALSGEELGSVQGELDSILGAVQKLGAGTDFAGQHLIDGSKGFTIENADPAFAGIQVHQAPSGFAPGTVTVDVSAAATRAQAGGTIAAAQVGDAQIEIRGALGTAVIDLADGATQQDVIDAVNSVKDQTGVEATAGGVLQSSAYGSSQFVEVRSLNGGLTGVSDGKTSGTDLAASVNGIQASAQGNTLTAGGNGFEATISLDAGTGPGAYAFQVTGGGFAVQTGPGESTVLGLPGLSLASLGASAGGLQSALSGGSNSLSVNPAGAAAVLSAAVDDLALARGRIGAFQANVAGPLSSSFQVAYENLAAAESRVGDTDFAATLAELAVRKVRQQAGLSVLAQAQRLSAQNALRLLG